MEEEQRESGGGAACSESRGGIRYITEELLLKLTGCQSVALLRSVNLSPSPADRRIKFIENLHGCQRLEVLKLNHNVIQRMERLNTLTQLRQLQLAHNHIQRIEGLELMSRLQHLDLSYNRINHIPLWFGKKLHSLHTLHLQHNAITSLYEVSRLRSLSSLSELSVSGNPASSLQHSRLFLLYHLRTLDRLDDLPITQEERGHAHQRFSTEELQRLQLEVDRSQSELSRLRRQQQVAVTRLHQQEETNRALTAQTEKQRHTHTLLEQEIHTKSTLLERTTAELTRAFHRLYELEQERAFYRIEARFRPLPPDSRQEVDTVDSAADALRTGEAPHTRSTGTSSSSCTSSLQTQEGPDVPTEVQLSGSLLEDFRAEQSEADLQWSRHTQQQMEAEQAECEETNTHTQVALCCLLSKLSVLMQLRDEAEETQGQTDGQTRTLKPMRRTDTPQDHVTAQRSSCRQMLDGMSERTSEMEDRLDDMLSRIAMETQEIKELEQQLTDGQILANEALQRDLEGIISGLQEYLKGLRQQARRSQQQVHSLQAENQNLLLHLEDSQRHCRQLEDTVRTDRQDMSIQQGELSVLQMEARALRDRQVEQEAELQQLREELRRQISLGNDEKSSLQEVVQRLEAQLNQTKAQFHQSRTQYEDAMTQLNQTRVQMDQITAAVLDDEKVSGGSEEPDEEDCSPVCPQDLLSRSVEQLYKAIQQTRTSRQQLQQEQEQSLEQSVRRQAQLDRDLDWDQDQLEAQVICREDQDSDWRLKEELQRLRVRLQRSESRNRHIQHRLEAELKQSRLQLQDVQQERDALLQQVSSQSASHRRSLSRLNRKLRQLGRSMCDADQLTAEQLRSTTEQLRGLNHTVALLHTRTDQNSSQLDGSFHQDRPSEHTLRLRQKPDRTRTRDGGQRCFAPPGLSAPSPVSMATQDSGLGLQYFSSPEGGRQRDRPPTEGGHWVHIPPTHRDPDSAAEGGVCGGGSDGSCKGPTPPPPPPPVSVSAGLPDGQTPLVGPAWLLCGSTPAVICSPPAGGAVLQCNTPEHRQTQVDRCVCDCLHREEETKKLRLETKQLRNTLRRHRCAMQVCDEVECVEKTLLKRRAELRQADRLLLEAQSCIHTTRDKASSAQREADMLQQTAADSATCLLEATQHVRELQEELEELRRRRHQEEQTLREVQEELEELRRRRHQEEQTLREVQEELEELRRRRHQEEQTLREVQEELEELRRRRHQEEQTLREVQEELRSSREELQQVSRETQSARDRSADLLSDCLRSQKHLDSLNIQVEQVEQVEQRLVQRREELQRAANRAEEAGEEEQRLHSRVQVIREEQGGEKEEMKELLEQQEALLSQRRSTTSTLREEEQKVITMQCELHTHRAELKHVLEEFLVGQQALEELKTKRSQSSQQLHRNQEHLNRIQAEVKRTQAELDTMREEVDQRRTELQEKKDQLDKTQEEVDRKREELAELQQEVQANRKEEEVYLTKTKQHQAELQQQQEELSRRRKERSSMEEQCKQLEARRRHADRCLSAVEAELARQKEELRHAQLLKQEVVRDTAATQEQLNENAELLSLLSEQVEERRKHLQTVEQELCVSSQQQQQRAEQLKELDREIQDRQALCVGMENVKAAVCELEDRGRRLTDWEHQINQLKEELRERQKQLLHEEEELTLRGEELKRHEEGLKLREEELQNRQEELCLKKDGSHKTEEEVDSGDEDGGSFYLSTAAGRSAFSSEQQKWKAELQRENLRQQEDRLKARLRCTLWDQQDALQVRHLETEDSLLGLKHRLDQLDSLLTHTQTHTHTSDSRAVGLQVRENRCDTKENTH